MKVKEKIREKISQYLDILIPANRWEQYIDLLDKDGIPNRKQLIGIFMIICQQIETLENVIEDINYELELIKSKDAVKEKAKEFKLRNIHDIVVDLEKNFNSDTKALYINSYDWKIMESNTNPSSPENGYGKMIDPKDNQEKTCMFYKELPVFKE